MKQEIREIKKRIKKSDENIKHYEYLLGKEVTHAKKQKEFWEKRLKEVLK